MLARRPVLPAGAPRRVSEAPRHSQPGSEGSPALLCAADKHVAGVQLLLYSWQLGLGGSEDLNRSGVCRVPAGQLPVVAVGTAGLEHLRIPEKIRYSVGRQLLS